MKTVELGRTGEQVSALALGCMLMGTATDEESSTVMLDRFVDLGGNHLDTADCYAWWSDPSSKAGESEELLGRWLKRRGRRDDVFLATKGSACPTDFGAVWVNGEADWGQARNYFAGAGADALRTSLDGSLRRLGVDHIDLYYVHSDDRRTPLEETLEALAGFVAAGKIRYIGWSNARTWRLERIRQLCAQNGWPAPVANQQAHTYFRPRQDYNATSIVDMERLDYLREHPDITLVAYTALLKGVYDHPDKRATHWSMAGYRGADAEARSVVLEQVAEEVGATPNQTVLAWLLHQDNPIRIPLVGPRTVEQFDSMLPGLDVKLTEDQLTRLDVAGA